MLVCMTPSVQKVNVRLAAPHSRPKVWGTGKADSPCSPPCPLNDVVRTMTPELQVPLRMGHGEDKGSSNREVDKTKKNWDLRMRVQVEVGYNGI